MASPFVKRYLLALNRYKWPGLFTFLSILGASSVVAFRPEPPVQFFSESILVDNSPLVAFSNTSDQVQAQGRGLIEEDFLLSDAVLKDVSARLIDRDIPLTAAALRSNTKVRVEAGGPPNTPEFLNRQVTVRYTSPDEETAGQVMDLMVETMIDLSQLRNSRQLSRIKEELDKRLPGIKSELEEAEQKLERYDRTEGPAIQASVDGSLLGAITGSQQQFRTNQITLAGIQSQIESIQAQLGLSPEEAYASSALSADPLIAQLRAQISAAETQQALLVERGLKPDHPSQQELTRNLLAYSDLLEERAREVLSGGGVARPIEGSAQVRRDSSLDPARAALANQLVALDTQREALQSQQVVIQRSEAELTQQYSQLPNKQLERNRLAQDVALRRALFDQLQARRVDAAAAEAETVSSLIIATPPFTVENKQERPSPALILLAGALTGLIVGGGVVYLLDMLDGTVRTSEELEDLLQGHEVPMLGLIPAMKTRSARAVPILVQSESVYNASYERLLSRLRLVGTEESSIGPRMLLLTSTRSQEGKSISAYNLAIASARAGRRTLLMEADLRNGSKAEMLGLIADPQVGMEPLRYYGGQIGQNVQMVAQVANLYICPSPGPQRQPAAILESSEMQKFLRDARSRFDMVILDAPALTRCDDALLLETQTDGLILVARPGITEKAVLDAAIEELEFNESVELLGAIVNAAKVSAQDLSVDTTDVDEEPILVAHQPEFITTQASPTQASPAHVSGRIDF
ncbi:MAG: cobalamin biosynthesis protein CobQ [Cyanobacteria bacterium P01_D01_bin.105]